MVGRGAVKRLSEWWVQELLKAVRMVVRGAVKRPSEWWVQELLEGCQDGGNRC